MLDRHRPHYHGAGLVNLMASLGHALGAPSNGHPPLHALPPAMLGRARTVLLMVIDGLGAHLLARWPESTLARLQRAVLTSVFPTTTASAITTFLTGQAPAQHGVPGWHTYLRELGAVWTVLPFKPRALPGHWELTELPVAPVLGLAPFTARLSVSSHVVTHQRIVDSGYSRATAEGAHRHAYEDLDGFFACLEGLLGGMERRYIYAYWPDLDALAHRYGVASAEVAAHFHDLDAAFARFLQRARGSGTQVILTADHGLLDTHPDHRLHLDDHPELAACLRLPLCGEPRAVFCYLKPGCEARFLGYLRRHLAHACLPVPGERLVQAGYFGLGPPHPELTSRVGDYVLLMKGDYTLKDRVAGERPFEPVGVHGGLSPEELYVPLILATL